MSLQWHGMGSPLTAPCNARDGLQLLLSVRAQQRWWRVQRGFREPVSNLAPGAQLGLAHLAPRVARVPLQALHGLRRLHLAGQPAVDVLQSGARAHRRVAQPHLAHLVIQSGAHAECYYVPRVARRVGSARTPQESSVTHLLPHRRRAPHQHPRRLGVHGVLAASPAGRTTTAPARRGGLLVLLLLSVHRRALQA